MHVGTKEKPVRLSFVELWEAKAVDEGSKPRFSVQVVIPKSDTEMLNKIKVAIDNAKKEGMRKGMFNAAKVSNPEFKLCLRDGDQHAAEKEDGSRDYLKGCMFFNAGAAEDKQPGIVDRFAKPIIRRDDVYSGIYAIVDVNFYPFKFGKGGVGAGLNNVMKREDGERLDGRMSAESSFANMADDEYAGNDGELV